MRILHIAPIGHHSEGIGSVLQHIVPEQFALGHEVRIISKYYNKTYQDLPIETILTKNAFHEFLSKWKPDVVLFHSVFHKSYIPFSRILLKAEIPYAVQMHGALSEENYKKSHFKKLLALKLMYARFLRNAKTLVYLNENEYNACIAAKYNNSAALLPNGCEIIRDASTQRPTKGKVRIIFVGRISMNHKGLDLLVSALRLLHQEGRNDFYLSLYGNEDDISVSWLKQELHSLSGIAAYCGSAYGVEKDRLLRSSDIMILTSRYEGMPMGILEALSYGLPCIVTTGTNMADVISDNKAGWTTGLSPLQIADTIKLAITDYLKVPEQFRQNAIKASRLYDWKDITQKSIKIFDMMRSTTSLGNKDTRNNL